MNRKLAATMTENLQSILADEVILPHDLLADDTTVIYDKKGNPVEEMDFDDPDDELLADSREIDRYKALVLAYYNGIHHTDYKFDSVTYLERPPVNSTLIHLSFTAFPSIAAAAAKQFCAKLQAPSEGEEVVTSCCIVDGPEICEECYGFTEYLCKDSSETRGRDEDTESEEVVLPLSRYSHLLADGVTLSDKAKLRLRFILLALAYYNKKQHADYKLVDGLPYCFSLESGYGFVCHLNFIARQNKSDASNKLFFAEFQKNRSGDWVVTACCVVRGKTTAGCHACEGRCGKRVVHPIRGYRFGLCPRRFGSCRARR